ncbi:MAG: hypothetical protein BWY25_02846 [Chloroflexi bacterium ADurb.Bin222]|nr:MAG: hypothetical protein BWY25_02846 [Chloroflexi bacterium ADurb.Bin222]
MQDEGIRAVEVVLDESRDGFADLGDGRAFLSPVAQRHDLAAFNVEQARNAFLCVAEEDQAIFCQRDLSRRRGNGGDVEGLARIHQLQVLYRDDEVLLQQRHRQLTDHFGAHRRFPAAGIVVEWDGVRPESQRPEEVQHAPPDEDLLRYLADGSIHYLPLLCGQG